MSDFSFPLTPERAGPVLTLQPHPVARLFPLMPDDEFTALVEDIAAHGQREPVLVHKGLILDGWHRACAVEQLQKHGVKIELQMREYDGPTDEATLRSRVISANLARRQLTQSQRAAIALDLLPDYEARAKERLKTNRRTPPAGFPIDPDLRTKTEEGIEQREEGDARELAASALGVSPRYVSDMKRVKRESPDLVEQVRQGELTVREAVRALDKNTPKSAAVKTAPDLWRNAEERSAMLIGTLMALKDKGFKVAEGLQLARKLEGFVRRTKPRESR